MADEIKTEQPAAPEPVTVPAYSFRTISMEEYRANYDKRGETPWPLMWDDGRWIFLADEKTKCAEIAVYKPEWNDGRPFVIPSSLISGGVKIKMIADADGKLLGTEEAPKEEAKSDEIQDGGGLRGVPQADQGDASGDQEAEESVAEAAGNPASE